MKATFTEAEVKYLTALVIDDHVPPHRGAAKQLMRDHHASFAALLSLFAEWALVSNQNQMDIADGPYPELPIEWPWSSPAHLETRLKELLPEEKLRYLEKGLFRFFSG